MPPNYILIQLEMKEPSAFIEQHRPNNNNQMSSDMG